jgi:hypothetical protein
LFIPPQPTTETGNCPLLPEFLATHNDCPLITAHDVYVTFIYVNGKAHPVFPATKQ